MQVAFVVGNFPELSETFILDQIIGLIERGHEVVVFGRAPTRGVPVQSTVAAYGLPALARHWPRGPAGIVETAARSLRLLSRAPTQTLRSLGRSLNVLEHGTLAATGKLWSYAAKALQEPTRFDVIVAHFGTNGLIAQRLRDVDALRGPLVTVFHGHDLSKKVRKEGPRLYRRLFERGELMLPVSDYFRARLIELGCPAERIAVQHMGVDSSRFAYHERLLCEAEPVRLISVCRLVEKKGIEFGLRAVAAAAARSERAFEWHIVGEGPLRVRLTALAKSLGIEQRVRFYGARTRDDVAELLRTAHVFFAPSVTSKDGDQEGIPVSIMEAAASGLPVLSTLHSGIAELVEDRVSGYLVPEWDVTALAERLLALVSQPALWGRMGERGREAVRARFEVDSLNSQLEERLESVASCASHG
jgi:colanic acid/amylovoran biosynthesis glycosyltransferase